MAFLNREFRGHELRRRQDGPTLFFDTINDLTTCEPAQFTWNYSGTQAVMTLWVTNTRLSPTTRPVSEISKVIAPRLIPTADGFRWREVDIPPGSYRLVASITSLNFEEESAIFVIQEGPDVSCLALPPESTTSSLPSPPPPVSMTESQSHSDPLSETSTSRPTESIPSLPQPGWNKLRVNTGTIVGIVIGVLALLTAFLAAYFFIRRRSKSGQGKQVGLGVTRGWTGLSSTDSRTALGKGPTTASNQNARWFRQPSSGQRRNHLPGDSMTSMQVMGSDEAFGAPPLGEKVGGGKYTSSRKNSSATAYDDYDGSMALANLPTLHHNREQPSNGRRPSYPDSVISNFASDRPRRDSRPLQDETAISRSSSVNGFSAQHHAMGAVASPATAEAKRANRNSIGAPVQRKRKPVPTYDPNEVALPSSSSPSLSPTPLSSSPMPSSALDHESNHDYHLHRTATSPSPQVASLQPPEAAFGHYTTRNTPSRPHTTESGEFPHKGSFGPGGVIEGKQLHYLIPDMPAESKHQ